MMRFNFLMAATKYLLSPQKTILTTLLLLFTFSLAAQVEIKGTAQGAGSAGKLDMLTDAHKSEIETELDRLFQHNDEFDPVIEELRKICYRREAERIASQL